MSGLNLFPFLMSCLVGALTTLACIELLKPVAIHIGLVDMPGGRKKHAHRVPLIGGIAIFIGFCFSLLCLNIYFQPTRGLLTGSAILVLIGVVDDFRELTPKIRLLGQFLAGLLLIRWGHISVDNLGNLFFGGTLHLGLFSWLLTLFCVLALINAINMIDGHDGLAGLVVMGQAAFLLFLSMQYGQLANFDLLLLLMVTLFIFLIFNIPLPFRKRASIFLGDAGSTFLGFIIAWFAVQLSQIMLSQPYHISGFNLLTILWILAYPLFDLLSVIIHRLKQGRSPFSPSRDHLHHLLMNYHVHPVLITYGLFIFSALLGILGIILAKLHVPEPDQLMLYLIIFAFYFLLTRFLHKKSIVKYETHR